MDVRGLSDQVSLAFERTQQGLATTVRRLSSGLRISSAADDPSGLAIAETLQTKVNGLDQGMHNVQDASNALTVAEGGMSSVSAMLQRIRSLVVESRSDLVDVAQRGDLQTEVDELVKEIDSIAEKTTFNGRALLDGSLSSLLPQPPRVLIPVNDALSGGGTLIDTTFDPSQPSVGVTAQQFTQIATVTSYDPISDSVNLSVTIASQDPSFGPSQSADVQISSGTNYPSFGFGPTIGNPTFFQTDQNNNPVLGFNVGALGAADVGKTSIIVYLAAEQKQPGAALQVNTGDGEGSIVSIDIPDVSAQTLGVNDIVLSSDDVVNQGNEYRVDYALSHLSAERATIGAQTVALQEAGNTDAIASVNYASSESAIRDAQIGAETVDYTRDEILRSSQLNLQGSLEQMQRGLAQLVSASIVG